MPINTHFAKRPRGPRAIICGFHGRAKELMGTHPDASIEIQIAEQRLPVA